MGTETAAELLYSLVMFCRPERILEIGGGYTSAFILRAVADSVANHGEELRQMAAVSGPTSGLPKDALWRPGYYRRPYQPRVLVIDDHRHSGSRAASVQAVAERTGCSSFLTIVKGTFPTETTKDLNGLAPIDFAWLDCGSLSLYHAYEREVWPRMNTDHGLVAIHSTETNLEAQLFIKHLKVRQATTEFCSWELLGLLEPHKARQNSLALLRFTSGAPTRIYSVRP